MPDSNDVDAIIVGGGPAALSCAIYTGRAELKTVMFEKQSVGGQVILTHQVDNYPGFPDGVSGAELMAKMDAQARRFGVRTINEEVTKITVDGEWKAVETPSGTHRSPALILAVGAQPRKLEVPGEKEFEGRGVSYCGTCDGPFFRDKKVVVVGGGDNALKEAVFLAKFASEILLVHRRAEFRAEKIYQTQAKNHPKISFALDSIVQRITGTNAVEAVELKNVKTEEVREEPCGGVFIFIGTVPDTAFLCNLFPEACGEPIATDGDMMTSIPGIFAIGDARKDSYRQIATAIGEGATAAIAAEHWLSKRKAKKA